MAKPKTKKTPSKGKQAFPKEKKVQPRERKILDDTEVNRVIIRIAHEILERNHGVKDLALIGIRTGGEGLARRLSRILGRIENQEVPYGYMDITMYRDDIFHIKIHPEVHKTKIDFPVEGKVIVLVDDVIFTGRSTRAAMDALMDMGRPKAIQLAVLIDRGHRELPIRPDFVGRNIPTSRGDLVQVSINEDADEKIAVKERSLDKVILVEGKDEE